MSRIALLCNLESQFKNTLKPPPLLVRIIHKSRLRYYGKFGLKIDYPYQVSMNYNKKSTGKTVKGNLTYSKFSFMLWPVCPVLGFYRLTLRWLTRVALCPSCCGMTFVQSFTKDLMWAQWCTFKITHWSRVIRRGHVPTWTITEWRLLTLWVCSKGWKWCSEVFFFSVHLSLFWGAYIKCKTLSLNFLLLIFFRNLPEPSYPCFHYHCDFTKECSAAVGITWSFQPVHHQVTIWYQHNCSHLVHHAVEQFLTFV